MHVYCLSVSALSTSRLPLYYRKLIVCLHRNNQTTFINSLYQLLATNLHHFISHFLTFSSLIMKHLEADCYCNSVYSMNISELHIFLMYLIKLPVQCWKKHLKLWLWVTATFMFLTVILITPLIFKQFCQNKKRKPKMITFRNSSTDQLSKHCFKVILPFCSCRNSLAWP